MLRYRVFNKSKENTILLVHGLYTNSGFWLSFLSFFKEFRLVILDLDFQKYLRDPEIIQSSIDSFSKNTDVAYDYVISHSLGTIFSNRLDPLSYQMKFDICPAYCSEIFNVLEYKNIVFSRLRKSPSTEDFFVTIKNIDRLKNSYIAREETIQKTMVFIPDGDTIVRYRSEKEFLNFSGDHFNIHNALLKIASHISI